MAGHGLGKGLDSLIPNVGIEKLRPIASIDAELSNVAADPSLAMQPGSIGTPVALLHRLRADRVALTASLRAMVVRIRRIGGFTALPAILV